MKRACRVEKKEDNLCSCIINHDKGKTHTRNVGTLCSTSLLMPAWCDRHDKKGGFHVKTNTMIPREARKQIKVIADSTTNKNLKTIFIDRWQILCLHNVCDLYLWTACWFTSCQRSDRHLQPEWSGVFSSFLLLVTLPQSQLALNIL